MISSQHTRKRVLTEFEETVARDLGASRVRYEDEIRAPLVRRGVSPEFLRMSSAASSVMAERCSPRAASWARLVRRPQ
jgi:hypothetical protein